jgi:hypothetical protein
MDRIRALTRWPFHCGDSGGSLALSESILLDVATVLDDVWQLPPVVIADYVDVLRGIAETSGGGIYTVPIETPFGTGVPSWMHDVARLIRAVEADAAKTPSPQASGTVAGSQTRQVSRREHTRSNPESQHHAAVCRVDVRSSASRSHMEDAFSGAGPRLALWGLGDAFE